MSFTFSTCEIAELAQEAEKKSAELYRELSRKTTHEIAKAVFSMLAEQEENHGDAFARLALKARQNADVHEYVINLRAILTHSIERMQEQNLAMKNAADNILLNEALELAQRIETGAVNSYQQMRASISNEFSTTLDSIIKLEQAHLKQVCDLRKKLQDDGLLNT